MYFLFLLIPFVSVYSLRAADKNPISETRNSLIAKFVAHNNKPFEIEDEFFTVTIDPNSVIFDEAATQCIGYSIKKIDKPWDAKRGAPSHLEDIYVYRYYTFVRDTLKFTTSTFYCSFQISKSITTNNRTLSLIIPAKTLPKGITGMVKNWDNRNAIFNFNIKDIQADENSITCIGHGINNDDHKEHTKCIISHNGEAIDIQFS